MTTAHADLIGAREACEIAGISRSTLTYWMLTGRLTPVHRLPGATGALLFLRAEVEAARGAA